MMTTSVKFRRRLSCTSSVTALLLAGAVIAGGISPAEAASPAWTGAASGNWFANGNWSTNLAPTAADGVTIDTAAPNAATINGGTANASAINVGTGLGTGALTILNGGALVDQNNFIGVSSDGTLTVSGGATITDIHAFIGVFAHETGTATVDGPNSSWSSALNLTVGQMGTGVLTISNGGQVSFLNARIGDLTGGVGTVTVTGAGSALAGINGGVTIGGNGTGTLTISGGGTATDNNATIGAFANSTGTATVDGSGSSWTTQTQLNVGDSGTGSLTISSGGQVSFGNATLGFSTGGVGTVTVTGAGSILNGSPSASGLAIGGSGTGTLKVLNGGQVNDGFGYVGGYTPGSIGSVVVDGSGSAWINNTLRVGDNGSGSLSVSNGGLVSALNATTIGNVAGSTGTVTVDGANSIISSSQLIVGANGSGTLTISNGGLVSTTGVGVSIAVQPGSTGVLNIGAAAGATPVAPGTLNASGVQFGAGTGTINFNHTASGYNFSSAMTGSGTINQIAGETILTANSGSFAGPTNVTGGRLAVNGSLSGSPVTVSGGGILGGIGTVGAIAANAGGIVAPGNSIGTLNVAGNVVFGSGSIYQVEVNAAGQGDKLLAGGTATINGATVQVLGAAGNYSSSTSYTILSATGGVTGTFAGVTSNLAFLNPSLTYDANNVNLLLARNSTSFSSVGITPNQIAAGGGVESLGAGNAVKNAVLNLSAPQARYAFDQLSGEVHASVKTALIEDSRFPRDAGINRLRSAFGGVGASSGPLAAYAADGTPVAVAATTDGLAFWGQAFGSFGSTDGDGNAARLSRSTGGFLTGGDAVAFDGVRIGALGGYSRTSFDVKDRASSGSSDNYHVGLYAGSQWGALGLRTGAAYTWHEIATSRSVAFAGFSAPESSRYHAGTAQVFGDLGYRIDAGHTAVGALAFEPFANLAYVNLSTGGFSETGAAALTGRSDSTGDTFSTLGLRASTDFRLNGMAATARGSLGWRHAYGDVTPTALLAFAGGGSSFSIQGVAIAKDSAVVDAGFDVVVARNVSVGFAYVGQAASHAQDHDFKANLNWKF
jgi:outer membrane autotransporter protein